jgi:hypothetical protein
MTQPEHSAAKTAAASPQANGSYNVMAWITELIAATTSSADGREVNRNALQLSTVQRCSTQTAAPAARRAANSTLSAPAGQLWHASRRQRLRGVTRNTVTVTQTVV